LINQYRYRYDVQKKAVETLNQDLSDSDLEVEIVSITNVNSGINSPYVVCILPLPTEKPQKFQSPYTKETNTSISYSFLMIVY
jgi:hypothetical protein